MKLLPKILALSLAMVVTTSVAANQLANEKTAISVNYKNNRYPLLQKPYIELPIGSIRPTGWMQEQLVRMKNGMTGNLDQVYEKVMPFFIDRKSTRLNSSHSSPSRMPSSA